MFKRLEAWDIKHVWDTVRVGVLASLPHTMRAEPQDLHTLLAQLIGGGAQCWVYLENGNILAHLITSVQRDVLSGNTQLNLYSLYAYGPVPATAWEDMRDKIEKYARNTGCFTITAATTNPVLVRLLERFGGIKLATLYKEV